MKKEATRQRPAGATSTGDREPLPGAEARSRTGSASNSDLPTYPDLERPSVPKTSIVNNTFADTL